MKTHSDSLFASHQLYGLYDVRMRSHAESECILIRINIFSRICFHDGHNLFRGQNVFSQGVRMCCHGESEGVLIRDNMFSRICLHDGHNLFRGQES